MGLTIIQFLSALLHPSFITFPLNFFFIVPEVFHKEITVSPIFTYFYPNLKICFHIHHSFNLKTGCTSDFLQHCAAFPNDDSFVTVTFTDDGSLDIHYFSIWTFFHFFNSYCNSVWNFFIQTTKCFFSDHFRNNLALWLICDSIFIVKRWSVWKVFEDYFQYRICILSSQCRYRYNICKFANIFVCINEFFLINKFFLASSR